MKVPQVKGSGPVETVSVDWLKPYERNSRTHSDEQVAKIARSIERFGFRNPIICGADGVIVAGHGRLLAAKMLGLEHVPVIIARGWTDDERRAFIIADNQIATDAGWDEELLRLELGDLKEADFDLSLIGFDESQLAGILDVGLGGDTDPDDVPEPPAEPVSRRGDIWTLGRHRIICGDSTSAEDVAALLDGAEPHLMVTDPPYGVNYDPAWRKRAGVNRNEQKLGKVQNDDKADWREAWTLFPGAVAYVWHAGGHTSEVQQSLEAAGFGMRAQIIWGKDRFALSRGHYHWQHEPCWYAVRGTDGAQWSGDRKQSTLWTINAREDGGHGHGTQKPVECMRRPIENNSKPGDAVYEPFSGSGTTIIAAEVTGRRCYAVELDPAYVDMAILRWQAFTAETATLGGRSFDEVAADRNRDAA